MKIKHVDNTTAKAPLVWKAGEVYVHNGRGDYWLCVNAPNSGGLLLANLENGAVWDCSPTRVSPANKVDFTEVKNVKVVVRA